MQRKTCLNPECDSTFESNDPTLLCPGCANLQEAARETEGIVSFCLNAACKKEFYSTDNLLYCHECIEKSATYSSEESKPTGDIASIVCITPECKRIFHGTGKTLICPFCERILEKAEQEKDDEAYEKLKSYINSHPSATVDEVHLFTRVAITKIKKFLEEGKFQLVLIPKCSRCGTGMPNARLSEDMCYSCNESLRSQITLSLLQQSAPPKASTPTAAGKNRKYGFGRE